MKNKHNRRKRRKFSPEYKAEVVALINQEGNSLSQVCQDMDLTESAVRRWLEQPEKSTTMSNSSVVPSEKEELQQLREENRRLKMERDILKKATAFFVKESQ